MKTILSAAMLFMSSIVLASADAAKSHAEVSDGVTKEMTTLMGEMAKITDVASAKAFAAKVPVTEGKLKALLKAAKALPAPTEAEKQVFQAKMEAAEEQMAPQMMAMMMGLAQNPEAEAIGKVLEEVMSNEEMDQVGEEFEELYEVEEEDGAAEDKPKIE